VIRIGYFEKRFRTNVSLIINGYRDTVRMERFKNLGTILKNQNYIQEEIKGRLKSENVCYYSTKKLLSSSLLSKNVKIKIYSIIILPVTLYGCETWPQT
jgi:hypothetical protein